LIYFSISDFALFYLITSLNSYLIVSAERRLLGFPKTNLSMFASRLNVLIAVVDLFTISE